MPSSRCSRRRLSPRLPGSMSRRLRRLAKPIAARQPYLPLIAVDPDSRLPENAIPFSQARRQCRPADSAAARRAARPLLARDGDAPAGPRPGARSRRAISIQPRRDRAADRPRRGLPCALGIARRADRRGRRAQHRGRAPSISTPATSTASCSAKVLALRVVDAFLTVLAEDARFRNLPVVVTVGRTDADLRSAEPRNHLRRSGLRRWQRIAADPPACLRGAFEPHAALDRRRRPDRCPHRPAHPGRVRSRFCNRRLSDAVSAAADCRWRASPSIPRIRAPSSTARGSSAA